VSSIVVFGNQQLYNLTNAKAASSIEEAMAAGERFADEFELGPVPTERLMETMERRLGEDDTNCRNCSS